MGHDLGQDAPVPRVEEVTGIVEGELLAVVAGNGQLTLQLTLGSP